MSLGDTSSESVFKHVFWDTLSILEKSSIGVSEALHLIYQFNVIWRFPSSFHQKGRKNKKKQSAHKRVNVYERSVITDEMQT